MNEKIDRNADKIKKEWDKLNFPKLKNNRALLESLYDKEKETTPAGEREDK